MSLNAAEAIANDRPRLLKKIEENPDVANVMIALLGKLVINYARAGEIRMSPILVTNNEFRSRVEVVGTPLIKPPQIVVRNDFRDYMAAKNIALAQVLTMNKHVADFFQDLLSRVVAYAEFKGIPFKDLKVIQGGAFISKDHEFVLRVGRESIVDMKPWDRSR